MPFRSHQLRTLNPLLRQSSTCCDHSARLLFSLTTLRPFDTIPLPCHSCTIESNRIQWSTIVQVGYCAISDMETHMKRLNEWVRRRIRQIYWKQWKRPKCRHDNLVRLGIPNSKAWEWAQSGKGYWRIADSFILSMSLTNEYLASVGYDDILSRYKVLHSNY